MKDDNNPFKTKLICQHCSDDFYVYTCSLKDGRHKGKYCSRKCAGKAKRIIKRPKTRICSGCKNKLPFTRRYFPVNHHRIFGLITVCRKCTCGDARTKNKDYQRNLRIQVLTAYGNDKLACVCCGENHYEFLCLDHINGGGGKERRSGLTGLNLLYRLRRLGFPKGEHRTLCCNCHQAYTEHGFCPHQKERS